MKNMKCIIVYFSQSGNTKKMAYAIRSGIQPFVEHCDIGRLDKIDSTTIAEPLRSKPELVPVVVFACFY